MGSPRLMEYENITNFFGRVFKIIANYNHKSQQSRLFNKGTYFIGYSTLHHVPNYGLRGIT